MARKESCRVNTHSTNTHTHQDWYTHHLFAVCPQHTECMCVWCVCGVCVWRPLAMWKVHLPRRIICGMLHVLANSATNSPPHLKATGAIDASRLALPSFSCSFYDYFPFSVLPLLVEATQITLSKEKERKCESAGQTYFKHTHKLLSSLHTLLTHTLL